MNFAIQICIVKYISVTCNYGHEEKDREKERELILKFVSHLVQDLATKIIINSTQDFLFFYYKINNSQVIFTIIV